MGVGDGVSDCVHEEPRDSSTLTESRAESVFIGVAQIRVRTNLWKSPDNLFRWCVTELNSSIPSSLSAKLARANYGKAEHDEDSDIPVLQCAHQCSREESYNYIYITNHLAIKRFK
jgi:hypothetical protein